MFTWLKKLINNSESYTEVEATTLIKNYEDEQRLAGFGYKVNWYMIPEYELIAKDWSIQDIADAIGLKKQSLMPWNEGVGFGYKHRFDNEKQIYISSPFEGWVYLINSTESELNLLNDIVENYYAFGSYRVVDYVAWKQVKDNKAIRHFAYADGEVLANIGVQTEEEYILDFINLSELNEEQAIESMIEDKNANDESIVTIFDEDHVIEMCIKWTDKDPSRFDEQVVPLYEMPKMGIAGYLIKA